MNFISVKGKDQSHYLTIAGALLVTLLGFGVRLHHLGSDAFWIDELLTLFTARGGIDDMIAVRDHPPLLYMLTGLSLHLFGESEFAVRLPALYAGTLALPLLIAFGKQLDRIPAGLFAALLLAFSPLHLHHSQEARHYAWLMTFSLASFVLLYRALKQPTWHRWLLYALVTVVNLYTHYGAFLVLGAQILIISVWLLSHLRSGAGSQMVRMSYYPVGAAAAVVLLYSPWLSQLFNMLSYNVGPDVTTSTGNFVPLSAWMREIYNSFSLYPPKASLLTVSLVLAGVVVWGWQREWKDFAFMIAGLILPLLLIVIVRPARGAFGRYVIYLLPFYLFFAGVFLSALLHRISRLGPVVLATATIFCLGGIGVMGSAAVEQEYIAKHNDWYGILQYLDERASEDHVLLMMSFNYEDGWNMVASTFSYYLHREQLSYPTLEANRIDLEQALALRETTVDIWGVVDNWTGHEQILKLPLDVAPFRNSLFVVNNKGAQGSTLAKTIDLYERLIPFARSPSPQCLLHQDLAYLRLASGDYIQAERAHERSIALCGSLSIGLFDRRQSSVELALLRQAVQANKAREARVHARNVLKFNQKHELALETLTVIDLATRFREGKARVAQNGAPETVRMERFTMPADGDSGEALLIHPPASVAFPLSLPESPVAFSSRIALSPASWEWGGDGATFVVQVQAEDGTTRELYRHHLHNDAADRGWHPVEFSLASYAGQDLILVLKTENGPAGDGTGDWAGWETPRLLWDVP